MYFPILSYEEPEKLIGVYSQEHAEKSGVAYYKTPDGGVIAVTAVLSQEPIGSNYKWSDTIIKGEVTEYLGGDELHQEVNRQRWEQWKELMP
jgi:hypothetical protein